MTFTLTKKHLIAATLITLFISFTLAIFIFPSVKWLFVGAAVIVAIISLVLWLSNKEDAVVKQQRVLEKQDQQLVKKLFHFFMQELKDRGQLKRKYKLPWYLFISHDLKTDESTLTQMGFRANSAAAISKKLPLQIWLKNDAIIVGVQVSSQDYRALNCLKLLIKKIINYRSRQTFNGIITSQSVDYLIKNNKSASQQAASDYRLVINEVQSLCGQKLPIYVLFNQMAGLADFCQFFSSLDEAKLEGAFGTLNTNKQQPESFQSKWFDQAYDKICRNMGEAVLSALDSQLSESFRRSAVAAPMQFKQIKADIGFYLEQLFISKESKNSYHFRGFFFTNSEQESNASDPLTKQVAYQLGFNEMRLAESIKLSHSIFVNHLFDSFIRPESGLATINKNRKRLFWGFQISYALVILSLITSVVVLLKVNFDYYQPLNAQTLIKLNKYQEQVRQQPYDIEELAGNIHNLAQIRSIYLDYIKPTPFYISDLIPNPALTRSVTQAYHDELTGVLLPSLVHYLEDELFVYETLGDTLKTAQLLNLNEELQLHDQESWQHLKSYYQNAFIKEGHSEKNTLKGLMSLMDDLYSLGVPKVNLNETLISQSRASLDTINTTKVLFDYISNLPEFASKVDISSELGNNFAHIYEFSKGYVGTHVPFLYTPQGFASIDLSSSSDLIKDLVHNNKALLGRELNDFEMNNLAKNLQRYYQRNYINYWLAFNSNISFKSTSADSIDHHLALLTLKTDNPLTQLYQTLSDYTSPSVAKPSKEPSAPAKLAAGVEKLTKIIPVDAEKVAMAKAIKAEFNQYHSFIKQDEKGISPLSHLQSNYNAVIQWLKSANETQDSGRYLFEQLTSNNKDHSLYQLSQTQVNLASIDAHTQATAKLIDSVVNTRIKAHINQIWQQQVVTPFNGYFANKFPFDLTSDHNVNFKAFNRFFKTSGQLSQFNKSLIDKFIQRDKQLLLTSFNRSTEIIIDAQMQQQLAYLLTIQQSLYQQSPEQFNINFKVKASAMSAKLLSFELFNQRSIFSYQHGPKLWASFTWPNLANQNDLLAIFTDTQGKKQTLTFAGQWAWLRLIYQSYQQSVDNTELTLTQHGNDVSLTLDVDGDDNPFVPTFFSRIKPNSTLL